jgi:hypothetical protein
MCGAGAGVEHRFCPSCGASLNLKSPYPQPGRPGPSVPVVPPTAQATVVTPTVGGSVRMGFGIALGMLLLFATVAVVLILAIGFASSTLTWPFAERGMRFEGLGPSDSVAVDLDGVYAVTWTATTTSPSACFIHATLRSPTDPGVAVDLANAPIEAGPEVTGARSVAVLAGPYYVHTESGCTWSIRLAHP